MASSSRSPSDAFGGVYDEARPVPATTTTPSRTHAVSAGAAPLSPMPDDEERSPAVPLGLPQPTEAQWRQLLRDEQARSAKLVAANAVLRETQQYLVEKCSTTAHTLTARVQELERELEAAQGSGEQLRQAREALEQHAQLSLRIEVQSKENASLRHELGDASDANARLLQQLTSLQDTVERLVNRVETLESEKQELTRSLNEQLTSSASGGGTVSGRPPQHPHHQQQAARHVPYVLAQAAAASDNATSRTAHAAGAYSSSPMPASPQPAAPRYGSAFHHPQGPDEHADPHHHQLPPPHQQQRRSPSHGGGPTGDSVHEAIGAVQPMMAALQQLENAVTSARAVAAASSGRNTPQQQQPSAAPPLARSPSAGHGTAAMLMSPIALGVSSSSPMPGESGVAHEKSAFSPNGSQMPVTTTGPTPPRASSSSSNERGSGIDGALTTEMLLERMARVELENRDLRERVSTVQEETRRVSMGSLAQEQEAVTRWRERIHDTLEASERWRAEALRRETDRIHAEAETRRARDDAEVDAMRVKPATADSSNAAQVPPPMAGVTQRTWQRRGSGSSDPLARGSDATTTILGGGALGSVHERRSSFGRRDDPVAPVSTIAKPPTPPPPPAAWTGDTSSAAANQRTHHQQQPRGQVVGSSDFDRDERPFGTAPKSPRTPTVASDVIRSTPPLPTASGTPPGSSGRQFPASHLGERVAAVPAAAAAGDSDTPTMTAAAPPAWHDDGKEDNDDGASPGPPAYPPPMSPPGDAAPSSPPRGDLGTGNAVDDTGSAPEVQASVTPRAKLPLKLPMKLPSSSSSSSAPPPLAAPKKLPLRLPVAGATPDVQQPPPHSDVSTVNDEEEKEATATTPPPTAAATLPPRKLPLKLPGPRPVQQAPSTQEVSDPSPPQPAEDAPTAPAASPPPKKLALKLPLKLPVKAPSPQPQPAAKDAIAAEEEAPAADVEPEVPPTTAPAPAAKLPLKLPLKLPAAPGGGVPAAAAAPAAAKLPLKLPLKLPPGGGGGAPPRKLPLKLPSTPSPAA